MSPKTKAVLYPLLAALLGALASYFGTGCTPAQLDRAKSAADAAVIESACVRSALREHDVLSHPELVTVEDAAALGAQLAACLKPPATPDAGA